MTSNTAVANIPRALVLPHPEYGDYPKSSLRETASIQFMGSCRFKGKGRTYARLGAQDIQAL